MATFIFDGTSNVFVPNFDPTEDTIIIEGFDVADVASFTQSNDAVATPSSSVNLTLASGIVLSLGGVLFSNLDTDNFSVDAGSDIELQIENGAVTGNIIVSQFGGDVLTVTTDDGFAYGEQGDDNIVGGGNENLTIFAGQGTDVVTAFGNGSIVYGNGGADTLTASAGAAGESVTVFGGSTTVGALDGIDNITGGAGDDLLYGNVGNDIINGADGDDTIFGGMDDDDILGGADDDLLYGNLGDDVIDGEAGDDVVFGGQGDDDISFGDGADAVYGNLDNDTLTSNGTDAATVVGGAGDDTISGDLGEGGVAFGGLGDDEVTLAVDSTADGETTSIFGGNGIVGAEDGDDVLTVSNNGDGTVVVGGNLGNDTITLDGTGTGTTDIATTTVFGGDGDDIISTSATVSNDSFTGGLGADAYEFLAGASTADEDEIDAITDFNFDEDTIDIGATTVSTVTIDDAATLAEIQAFGTAGAATVINVTGGDLAGSYLTNGDTAGDTFINITGFSGTVDADAFV